MVGPGRSGAHRGQERHQGHCWQGAPRERGGRMSVSSQRGWRWLACAVLSVVCAALNTGCGYSLAGRGTFLPAYIKTIGVPNFTNRTTVFNLESQLTQKVRSEFIGRGKYQIVPEETGVDAVLIGEILSARIDTAAVQSQLASTQGITVTARVELRDVRQNTVIWQNASLSFRADYPA